MTAPAASRQSVAVSRTLYSTGLGLRLALGGVWGRACAATAIASAVRRRPPDPSPRGAWTPADAPLDGWSKRRERRTYADRRRVRRTADHPSCHLLKHLTEEVSHVHGRLFGAVRERLAVGATHGRADPRGPHLRERRRDARAVHRARRRLVRGGEAACAQRRDEAAQDRRRHVGEGPQRHACARRTSRRASFRAARPAAPAPTAPTASPAQRRRPGRRASTAPRARKGDPARPRRAARPGPEGPPGPAGADGADGPTARAAPRPPGRRLQRRHRSRGPGRADGAAGPDRPARHPGAVGHRGDRAGSPASSRASLRRPRTCGSSSATRPSSRRRPRSA